MSKRVGDRRLFLKALGLSALAPLFGAAAAAAQGPMITAGIATAGRISADMVRAFPSGGLFLVNGWVLTRADLAALGLDDL